MAYKVPFVNYPLAYWNLEKEIDSAIKDVLNRGDLLLREDVEKFEKNLASFTGTSYAVGVNSGADALIFSLKAAGVGPGDEVITVSHTFAASIASIVHVGAKPVLVDVGEDFFNEYGRSRKSRYPKDQSYIAGISKWQNVRCGQAGRNCPKKQFDNY